MRALCLFGVGALLWSCPAFADGPIPCTCRAAGTSHALGAVVCLKTPDGPRLARCERVLNNTSWTPLATPCPTAGAGRTILAGLAAPGE
jgi:hypothetical protein